MQNRRTRKEEKRVQIYDFVSRDEVTPFEHGLLFFLIYTNLTFLSSGVHFLLKICFFIFYLYVVRHVCAHLPSWPWWWQHTGSCSPCTWSLCRSPHTVGFLSLAKRRSSWCRPQTPSSRPAVLKNKNYQKSRKKEKPASWESCQNTSNVKWWPGQKKSVFTFISKVNTFVVQNGSFQCFIKILFSNIPFFTIK